MRNYILAVGLVTSGQLNTFTTHFTIYLDISSTYLL
jgi:hypothetical protein